MTGSILIDEPCILNRGASSRIIAQYHKEGTDTMRVFITAAAVIAVLICCGPVYSQQGGQPYSALVIGQPTPESQGLFWNYSIFNTSSSSEYGVWLLAVEVDENVNVIGAFSPIGWQVDTEIPHLITWICMSGYVSHGETQVGFAAAFDKEPVFQGWAVMFRNQEDPSETPVDFGEVASVVPEASGLVVILTGIAPILATLRRKK